MLVRSRLAEFGMDGLKLRSLFCSIAIEKIEKRENELRRYIGRGTFALAWEEQA
ncbi:hypothetical protein MHI37_08660 [Paenibacillus sp. FSL H8-0548]|uniref:hypothetical protein n=1 Tax=Paenibacillus sp. FSL H8-0548 TaxID=1920422 RepID=UPI0015C37533|nr:hypothetical protein [Paenibacillus sp. FSL H8-0548]